MTQPSCRVVVDYEIPLVRADWLMPEETLPESQPHDLAVDLLKLILLAFIKREGMSAQVARNLAIRFSDENPRVGIDPDLCLLVPQTPEGDNLRSLRRWEPRHIPPVLSIEVVSETNPRKDYVSAPERHAASGCGELWIFDPLLAGPTIHGGPHRIQIWQRDPDGSFHRAYAGSGPVYSETMECWLHAVEGGRKLRLANDEAGNDLWLTGEEEALARVAELEAALKARS